MVSVTYGYRRRPPVPNRQRRIPRAAARAIEIQLPIEATKANRTLYRIFIPRVTAAEPLADQMRAASNTHADEEPTWEDAEWQ